MEVNVNTLSDVSREVEITATAEEVQPLFEKKYQEYRAKVEIHGFRKGKAPLDIVKKLYGELIEQDSLQDVATELYRKAVVDEDLKPIGDPSLVDMNFKRGEEFKFKVRYDIRPTVMLKSYDGVKVTKPVHVVTTEEVDAELLRLRRANATFEPAATASDDEHVVTADLQDVDAQGMPLIGKRSENVRFYLADDQLEDPFKQALRGTSAGQDHRIQFEHDHGDHKHSVNTRVSVKKVEKVTLPPFDDAFVKTITKEKASTTGEFLTNLRNDIEAYWKSKSERSLLNNLTGELLKLHDFAVPDSLTRAVLEGLLQDMAQQYPKKQLPADFDYERFGQENFPYAQAQAKWALLREELLKAEAVSVDDSDLEKLAEAEAATIQIDKERLLQYYKSSDQIRDRLMSDKLMQQLLKKAKVEEVVETTPTHGTKG